MRYRRIWQESDMWYIALWWVIYVAKTAGGSRRRRQHQSPDHHGDKPRWLESRLENDILYSPIQITDSLPDHPPRLQSSGHRDKTPTRALISKITGRDNPDKISLQFLAPATVRHGSCVLWVEEVERRHTCGTSLVVSTSTLFRHASCVDFLCLKPAAIDAEALLNVQWTAARHGTLLE